jgi:O-succinylbenzoic acid--CoA ligase
MTESGGGVVYNGFPLDGVELKIVEDEIYIRCAMLFRNYRHETSASTHDGWYSTGDLGSIDQTGRLQVFGRRTDMIISGGENIWPATVETSLLTHPLVEQVVVRGTPDAQWGQQVVAYVVLNSAASQIAPQELRAQLRDHVKQTLPAFCAPHKFVIVNDIPRTSLGKVDVSSLPSP